MGAHRRFGHYRTVMVWGLYRPHPDCNCWEVATRSSAVPGTPTAWWVNKYGTQWFQQGGVTPHVGGATFQRDSRVHVTSRNNPLSPPTPWPVVLPDFNALIFYVVGASDRNCLQNKSTDSHAVERASWSRSTSPLRLNDPNNCGDPPASVTILQIPKCTPFRTCSVAA